MGGGGDDQWLGKAVEFSQAFLGQQPGAEPAPPRVIFSLTKVKRAKGHYTPGSANMAGWNGWTRIETMYLPIENGMVPSVKPTWQWKMELLKIYLPIEKWGYSSQLY